jgi:hypothetical protein
MNAGVNEQAFEQKGYKLEQNIPNPAAAQTSISYFTPGKENIIITLFNEEGKEVAVLVDENQSQGEHTVSLDMTKYSSGIYFYKMQVGNISSTKKLVLKK